MSNYFYHLSVNKKNNRQWKVGDTMAFDGYNNYFRNFINLSVYCMSGNNEIPIDYVIAHRNDYPGANIAENQRANVLHQLHRELVFEKVRSSYFSHLPSRQTCTFLMPLESNYTEWLSDLNETGDTWSLLLVEPLPDARLFRTSEGPLRDLNVTVNDDVMLNKAKQYWSGPTDGRIEILMQGGAKVLEVVSTK